jgi:hypothetical protein
VRSVLLPARTPIYDIADQLPLRSPVLGAVALSAIVGVPYSVLAVLAWRGGPRVDQMAVLSGGLLIGWILAEALILEESSFLEPLYAAIGAGTVATGYRWMSNGLRRHRRLIQKG